jgi:4-amino-4-deoxy-L-arabinose transferase-like glycosyltransferase
MDDDDRNTTSARPSPTRRGPWLLLLCCVLLFLPGQCSLPTVDRDEARFAQASRQMLESDTLEGWVVPRVQDRLRLNKPPVIYWLQAASVALLTAGDSTRDAIWMYRVPSLLCAVGTVFLTSRLGRRLFDNDVGLVAGLMMVASPMLIWDAHQARSDQLLVFVSTAAMSLLWELWRRRDRSTLPAGLCAAFWFTIGLGVMSKGPITPLIALLTAVTLAVVGRSGRWLWRIRPISGLLIVAAIVAPWVILVGVSVGWEQYLSIISDEVLNRAANAKEGHAGPPGYHLLLLAVLFWPGSLVALAAIVEAVRCALRTTDPIEPAAGIISRVRGGWSKRAINDDRLLFLAAWLIPAWLVFECVSTKLPHYPLPLYPALAILCARLLVHGGMQLNRMHVVGCIAWALIGLGFVIALHAGLWIGLANDAFNRGGDPHAVALPRLSNVEIGLTAVLGAAALLPLSLGLIAATGGRMLRALAMGLLVSILVLAPALQFVLPSAALVWITPRVAHAVESIDPAGLLPIAAVSYHEDSLIFATRGRVERVGRRRLADWLDSQDAAIVIAPIEVIEQHDTVVRHVIVDGFNYSNGDRTTIAIATQGISNSTTGTQDTLPSQ